MQSWKATVTTQRWWPSEHAGQPWLARIGVVPRTSRTRACRPSAVCLACQRPTPCDLALPCVHRYKEPQECEITIRNLMPGIMYMFRVAALNDLGLGEYSKASVSTYTKSKGASCRLLCCGFAAFLTLVVAAISSGRVPTPCRV